MSADKKIPAAAVGGTLVAIGSVIGPIVALDIAGNGAAIPVWWLTVGAMLVASLLIAKGCTGKASSLLVDGTNRMSLAQLQLILWTFLLVSLFTVAVAMNLAADNSSDDSGSDHIMTAFTIAVPGELWALAGISVTSLAGTPLLQNSKRGDGDPVALRGNPSLADAGISHVDGVLTLKKEPSWADVFSGEDTGNAARVDVGKIQMFYFTILLVIGYAAAALALFSDGGPIEALPQMNEAFVALLGISHAGFLANEAVPRP